MRSLQENRTKNQKSVHSHLKRLAGMERQNLEGWGNNTVCASKRKSSVIFKSLLFVHLFLS